MEQFMTANIDVQFSVLPFLRDWWKNHILCFDQKYMPYLKKPKSEEYARTQSSEQKKEQKKYEQKKEKRQQSTGNSRNKSPAKDEKYYASILDLSFLITKDNLKKAYRQKVKEYHPDRVANLGIKLRMTAEEEMEKINEAFDFFRKKYGPL